MALRLVRALWLLPLAAHGYIPATATNDSASQVAANDPSWFIQLNWHPIGIFSDGVSRQLRADNVSASLHQGVLLHFSELNATAQPPANVPWIAMIKQVPPSRSAPVSRSSALSHSCDTNSSAFSMIDDIFTLARDRGAAAAMLYSLTSKSCIVNPDYLNNFEKPLDVFSSGNLQGARLIESQFSNVVGSGYWFQSDLLNSSATTILKEINQTGYASPSTTATLAASTPESTVTPEPAPSLFGDSPNSTRSRTRRKRAVSPFELAVTNSNSNTAAAVKSRGSNNSAQANNGSPVYLIATLANSNAISNPQQTNNNANSSANGGGNNGPTGNANTGLAMIILYAITGCVTLMFLIVIISGAIRAIRHPERYGPRPGRRLSTTGSEEDPDINPQFQGRQTRAAGLTRAILDTFPVVKFGRSTGDDSHHHQQQQQKVLSKDEDQSFVLQNRAVQSVEALDKPKEEQDNTLPPPLPTTINESSTLSREPNKSIDTVLNSNQSEQVSPNETRADIVDREEEEEEENPSSTEMEQMVCDVNNSVTCPICVCDFDAEDDIRVLPCDARHRFHQECVDPWLLNISRFCPLCRWDLSTRKDGTKIQSPTTTTTTTATTATTTSQQPRDSSSSSTTTVPTNNGGVEGSVDRPTEAQIVANLRVMLQNSRPRHQHQQQQQGESKSRLKKYINLVRGLRRPPPPPPPPATE